MIALALRDINKSAVALFGGKAANLAELTRIEGILVPDGFCISTEAFKRIIPSIENRAVQMNIPGKSILYFRSAAVGEYQEGAAAIRIPFFAPWPDLLCSHISWEGKLPMKNRSRNHSRALSLPEESRYEGRKHTNTLRARKHPII